MSENNETRAANAENENEKPAADAVRAVKARWSIRKALKNKPKGMPFKDLAKCAQKDWPGKFHGAGGQANVGSTLAGMQRNGEAAFEGGRWRLIGGPESGESPGAKGATKPEPEFYQPVADRLVAEGICTDAKSSGDKLSGAQWTNPDVVGLVEAGADARLRGFPTQLVAVEVKCVTDSGPLLTGFAEACAYLDFAHVSWLVVPSCNNAAIRRVTRLCVIHGLGLACFQEEDVGGQTVLSLDVRVHPRCHKPGAREFSEFLARLRKAKIRL